MKMMDLREFVAHGYLQEVNRQFFHPLGLALVVEQSPAGVTLLGLQDDREDPEGIAFAEETITTPEVRRKAAIVSQAREDRDPARYSRLGYVVQPIPPAPVEGPTLLTLPHPATWVPILPPVPDTTAQALGVVVLRLKDLESEAQVNLALERLVMMVEAERAEGETIVVLTPPTLLALYNAAGGYGPRADLFADVGFRREDGTFRPAPRSPAAKVQAGPAWANGARADGFISEMDEMPGEQPEVEEAVEVKPDGLTGLPW